MSAPSSTAAAVDADNSYAKTWTASTTAHGFSGQLTWQQRVAQMSCCFDERHPFPREAQAWGIAVGHAKRI
eukprot:2538935-Pleurochrysis_carterae.AAC.1